MKDLLSKAGTIVRLYLENVHDRLEASHTQTEALKKQIHAEPARQRRASNHGDDYTEASYQNLLRDKITRFQTIQNSMTGSIPYEDYTQMLRALALTREVFRADEHIKRGTEIWQNFIVGTGLTFTIETENDSVRDRLQEYADHWIDSVGYHEIQRQTIARDIRDGETFLRLFDGPVLRFVEPEYIGRNDSKDSSVILGIKTENGDTGTVVEYHVSYNKAMTVERVPSHEMYHSIMGDMGGSVRGFPYMWPVVDNAFRATQLLSNISTCAKTRAAFGFIASAKEGTNRTAIQAMLDRQADWTHTSTDGTTERFIEIGGVKGVYNVRGDMDYQFPSANMNVGDLLKAYEAEVRAIASCFNCQYEWISADSSQANRASMESASEPAYKGFEAMQSKYGCFFSRILRDIIIRAIQNRAIGNMVTVPNFKINVDYPSMVTRDTLKEAQAYGLLLSNGVVSIPTVQRELGYDPEGEQKLIEESYGMMPRSVQDVALTPRDDNSGGETDE